MTVDQFLQRTENYYGLRYRDAQVKVVEGYLKRQPAAFLERLYAETLKAHSAKYRSLPDIAVFEPIVNDLWERREQDKLADHTKLKLEEAKAVPRDQGADMVGEILKGLTNKAKARGKA